MATEKSYEKQTKSNEQQAEKLQTENFGSKTILKVFLQLQQRRVYLKL